MFGIVIKWEGKMELRSAPVVGYETLSKIE